MPLDIGVCIPEGDFVPKVAEICECLDYTELIRTCELVIAEYIRHQLEEDLMADQMSIKEYTDPFTGSQRK